MTQMVKSQTRVTEANSSIIDHIYSTFPENIIEITVPKISLSDDYPICFTRKIKQMRCNSPSKHTTIKYRSFSKCNENEFNMDLLNYGIDYVESIPYPSHALDIFYNIFYDVLNKHAPIKVKRIKRQHQPDWYSEEIKHARKTRDLFHAKKDWNNYKVWRNNTIKLIEQVKTKFYNNAIKEKSDSKLLWKHIKTVSSDDIHKPCSLPSTLIFHGSTFSKEHNIINALTCHFINIAD